MSDDEITRLKAYISNDLLPTRVTDMGTLSDKYNSYGNWSISNVISENDFTSMMKAKLLNQILNLNGNEKIADIMENCKDFLPQAFGDKKVKFVFAYDNEILKYRNKLAHVKHLNANTPVFIGKINGEDCYCTTEFCSNLRASLIRYGDWFHAVYDSIVKG